MGRRNSDDNLMLNLAIIFLALLAMPIVGFVVFINAKSDGGKLLGIVLMIVGVIIWIMNGVH